MSLRCGTLGQSVLTDVAMPLIPSAPTRVVRPGQALQLHRTSEAVSLLKTGSSCSAGDLVYLIERCEISRQVPTVMQRNLELKDSSGSALSLKLIDRC